jgi:hypothetical protein
LKSADIDKHVVESVAQLRDQQVERVEVQEQRLVRRLLGTQDVELLGVLDQHAVHEQAIDPAGVLEGFTQAMARLQVERQRHCPELQIEVDQGYLAPPLVSDQPGDAGRDHGCSDTASGAGDGHQLAELVAAGFDHAGGRVRERLLQQGGRDRLDQVVGDAMGQQIAEDRAVVALAERDHGHARLADVGQAVDVGERQLGLTEVDQQQPRRAMLAQVLDRLFDPAFTDRGVLQRHLADHLVDDGISRGVGAKGEKRFELRIGARLLGGFDRGCH